MDVVVIVVVVIVVVVVVVVAVVVVVVLVLVDFAGCVRLWSRPGCPGLLSVRFRRSFSRVRRFLGGLVLLF